MAYLTAEIAAYYAVGAGIAGLLIGWIINQSKCNKIAAALESEKEDLQTQIDAHLSTIREQDYQLDAAYRNIINVRSELSLAEGNAALNHSRWQSTLKQAREGNHRLAWVKSLQSKLGYTRVQLQQNRQYAEVMAKEACDAKANLSRVHTRLTEVDATIAGLKDWIHVFQTKLVKTKTEYAELRSYADAVSASDRANHENLIRTHNRLTEVESKIAGLKDWIHVFQTKLVKTKESYGQLRSYANVVAVSERANHDNLIRAHNRLTEIEHKQQPLRTWIRVFQTKLMKTKSEYEQLRHYSENIQADLDAKEDNLQRTHSRLTLVSKELDNLKDRRKNPLPPIPPAADVSDSKTLRLVDRIRLLGTSKNAVYGRMHNQIREAKLETIETERVLTDSCEEKDAVIEDLRGQIHKLENKLQSAPVVSLEESVRIKELEAEIGKIKAEHVSSADAENMLREHQLTIDAYRLKLDSLSQQPAKEAKPKAASSKKSEKPAKPATKKKQSDTKADTSPNDDLKEIKGIGPKIESVLNELGITRFEQIAAWKKDDIEAISEKLGNFKDRISRDEWVKKAKKLHKRK
ncbi:MAG: hypothetical protein AAF372_04350 [Pseudomonadota bacterium]